MKTLPRTAALCFSLLLSTVPLANRSVAAQERHRPHPESPLTLLPLEFRNSLEYRWLGKPVERSRVLDDMTDAARWQFSGTGALTQRPAGDSVLRDERVLRIDVNMYIDSPAPTRNRLSAVNLRRDFGGEDWRAYNRISIWIRPDIRGFPMLPLQLVLRNDGTVKVPDVYRREGTHYVTLRDGAWQQVVWEIEPLARDRVMSLEIGYWANKMFAAPGDRVGFEIARLELQQVEPDHVEGWQVAPGRLAFSHSGYLQGARKTALATDLAARAFSVVRVEDNGQPEVVFTGPVQHVETRLGLFQQLDFSALRTPGTYALIAGDVRTPTFRVGADAWRGSIEKALNFFSGERCGHAVEGSHGVCHIDWTATLGGQRVPLNGGWHDAGDLSQGTVNTGEATYALFALAERLQVRGDDPALLARVLDEAKWGLDWLLRVRFDGGYRVYFASNNLWTNGRLGDADDRTREAKNNPNVNYIAAAAGALAYRVLKDADPVLAERALRIAQDDWRHAIVGVESTDTRDTNAFAATRMELAGIGALASMELYAATGGEPYAAKAKELAREIVASQQKTFVGSDVPLAGFFYTGPDRDTIFHQFHRGNDQAPVVALARLVEAFPDDPEWMDWYAAVVRYAEYQAASTLATAPWGVLPAYVYHEREALQLPDSGMQHLGSRASFLEQVRRGTPLGDGYYLRAFPVWYARRGNYGVLLSQAKALSTAAQLRRDPEGAELAQLQAQWVVGRNPFAQSTMVGEGYDWAQQYSVSSGDFAGALPVGVQSRGDNDEPYWPAANMYVYKEVWIHPAARWLWLMADLRSPPPAPAASAGLQYDVSGETSPDGVVTIRLRAIGSGTHRFALRTSNLTGGAGAQTLTLRAGAPGTLTWRARLRSHDEPWVAVVVPDGDVAARRDAYGMLPRYAPRAPEAAAAPRVIGYLGAWSPTRKGLRIADIPATRLTHLFYAFGRVTEQGVAELAAPCLDVGECGGETRPDGVDEGGNFAALRALKRAHPHLRVLISLGGWGGSQWFSDAAVDDASRRRLVQTTLDVFLRAHPDVFDGVDVDWEYPVRGGPADNTRRPEDRHNYTLLLEEYRRQLDALGKERGRRFELSIAAAAGGAHVANLELDRLAGLLDFINIMTYDFHSGSRIAHFNSPLHPVPDDPNPAFNVAGAVQLYLDGGMPREQLVVGVPFYGRGYGEVAAENDGLLQPGTEAAAPAEWRSVDWRVLAQRDPERAGFTRHWSAEAQVPWLYNPTARTFFSYDDPASIAAKARWVREQRLGGVMFWELGGDDGSLLRAVHQGLRTPRH